jgi:eukaryotic-like serine/threonine-protein kinase
MIGVNTEAPPRGGRLPAPTGWDFAEGDRIWGDLYALQLLGRARRYEAYLAWHDAMLTTVVVKILRPDRVEDSSALEGLAEEARALRALDHPVLPRGFDQVLDGSRPHLVLEFLEGPRLSTLIRKYPLAVEQVIPLAIQLASAIHFMGARRWVHLDVKPKNIIMGAPPRLIDLSVAHTIEDAAALDVAVGTDAYMAPEQIEPGKRGVPGPPSDVWGIGVSVFEALVGDLPFGRGTDEDRFPQLHRDRIPFPGDIPPAVADILAATLAPDPSARPTARELAESLEPLLDALPKHPVIGMLKPRLR